ncbi:MAG: hypothetical protein M5U14_10990 [Acidimicrobiia bacterium]|nr:hypothetical protein [Acidimicrobiia bacterium]
MRCDVCGHDDLVEIRMRVGEREVAFRRCSRCEAQAWRGDEGDLPLAGVLELARAR